MEQRQPFDQADWATKVRATRRRRTLWTVLVVAIVLLALFYAGRVFWLNKGATEGDVPPASALPLPEGAEVLGDSIGCGSGGCTATFTVRPPAGQSPEALAEDMGVTPLRAIPGTFWDPRTVLVTVQPAGSALNLHAHYRVEELFK